MNLKQAGTLGRLNSLKLIENPWWKRTYFSFVELYDFAATNTRLKLLSYPFYIFNCSDYYQWTGLLFYKYLSSQPPLFCLYSQLSWRFVVHHLLQKLLPLCLAEHFWSLLIPTSFYLIQFELTQNFPFSLKSPEDFSNDRKSKLVITSIEHNLFFYRWLQLGDRSQSET